MRFHVFKNTVLLFVLVLISCGNTTKTGDGKVMTEDGRSMTEEQQTTITVGANQTETYIPLLKGKRIGIVANPTSVVFKKNNKNYTHLVDSLLALNIKIAKVFSPEHGFRGTADAGELVNDSKDAKTGLQIVSLHGEHRKPKSEDLSNVDLMVFDLQDVGVRFYTYISTLHYVMEACAEANIPLIILDRPNPNGSYIDGPTLEIENQSFLGMHPIPLVHGMTIGEYAKMINGEKWLKNGIQSHITVIPVKNYNHNMPYSLPIRPSPNLPNDQSIQLYPSLGLFEGTDINAGRGTEFQFQRYGAPFLDKSVFTFSYTPVENFGAKNPKHKGKLCYGEDLKNEKATYQVNLKWLIKAYNNASDKSKVFNTANFTKHAGTDKLQKQIEAGLTEEQIKATWQKGLESFKNTRKKYLIYN
ncbi:MAG: exo-beta-N-acetylmuramidase NamZ domain-containing protein [Flavobacteriales bacterium]